MPSLVSTLALLAYPMLVIGMFLVSRPVTAVVWAYLLAWLYLPLAVIDLPGLPDYGKFTACNIIILPCIAVFDLKRFLTLRFSISDVVISAWVLCPMLSSLANGLGVYDGFSGAMRVFLTFAVPYIVGKCYLSSAPNLLYFRNATFLAASSYIPLCLFESRMSPHLHSYVYGYVGRANWEYKPEFAPFGWQPNVFMNSAFEIALLMVIATLFAFWAWKNDSSQKIMGIKPIWWTAIFVFGTIMCKKWTGMGLMVLGIGILTVPRKPVLVALAAVPVIYMSIFISGLWRGEGLGDWVSQGSERRAGSLEFRLRNDRELLGKALQRPVFGWGGWGRNRIVNDEGKDVSVTDSLWMITLGVHGMFGLGVITLFYLLSPSLFTFRSANSIPTSIAMPLVVVLLLHTIDNLFNAFPNSVYPMFVGALSPKLAFLPLHGTLDADEETVDLETMLVDRFKS